MSFGQGSVTIAYRPIAFERHAHRQPPPARAQLRPGRLDPRHGRRPGRPIPDACITDPSKLGVSSCRRTARSRCRADQFDGMPEVELFDRTGAGAWHRLPHLTQGQTYDVADAGSYVDPSTGRGPGPVRQRPPGSGRRLPQRVDRRGRSSDRRRRHPRARQALSRHARGRGHGPDRRRGRDLRPRRTERRRQDDHAADPRDAPHRRRRATPRSPASTSAGTPTRLAASSASCRTSSGSTTT